MSMEYKNMAIKINTPRLIVLVAQSNGYVSLRA